MNYTSKYLSQPKLYILTLFILFITSVNAQNLDVEGEAKISIMNPDPTAQFIVVRQSDGTLAIRDVSTIEDGDASPINEIQDLDLNGNILTITMNGSAAQIDLSGYLDNTDSQTLALNSSDLSISGGNVIDLSPLEELPPTAMTNDVLTWDGAAWVAQATGGGGDNLGNHIATQPLQLVNMTTDQRDAVLNPTAGMLIYNSETGRIEFFQELLPVTYLDIPNNGNTETGCTSIAQSFKVNSSFFINEIETKIDFNGATGDVTLKIFDGDGVGGSELFSETFAFASIPVQNGNEYNFVLTNPYFTNCCPTLTFEITQVGNTNMTAHIDFRNMVAHDVTGPGPIPDGYLDGKFYKDGVNSDAADNSGFPVVLFTRRDLHFTMTTQRKQWTQ
jgi:hypothetical protein